MRNRNQVFSWSGTNSRSAVEASPRWAKLLEAFGNVDRLLCRMAEHTCLADSVCWSSSSRHLVVPL